MTPEEARTLEPGTAGPWEHDKVPGPGEDPTRSTEVYPQDESGVIAYVQPNAADVALIAAAPDMRAYIAAQTWEWRVIITREGIPTIVGEWTDEESAREDYQFAKARRGRDVHLVRRPVGRVEVVE